MVCTLADIRFEMVSILYNIGALHSQLGASDSRVTADGMKLSCTHFQCAAWAFQVFHSACYWFCEMLWHHYKYVTVMYYNLIYINFCEICFFM
jgi:hypothetical protein